jgi:hypothetical protein
MWIIGVGITIIVAFITALLAGFYRLSDAITRGDSDLHQRVNDVRDEYVRRADMDAQMARIDGSMRDIRTDMKEQYRDIQIRLDSVLAALKFMAPPNNTP